VCCWSWDLETWEEQLGFRDKVPTTQVHTYLQPDHGFHRTLHHNISFAAYFSKNYTKSNCQLELLEYLNKGVYLDEEELKNHGKLDNVVLLNGGTWDTENPQYKISSCSLLFSVHKISNFSLVGVSIPIHFRYHEPSTEHYTNCTVYPPLVYFKCGADSNSVALKIQSLRNVTQGIPPFTKEDLTNTVRAITQDARRLESIYRQNKVVVRIPIGDKSLEVVVTIVTLITTIVGCIHIIYTSFKYS